MQKSWVTPAGTSIDLTSRINGMITHTDTHSTSKCRYKAKDLNFYTRYILLILLFYTTFSVFSLQLKQIRWCYNISVIDQSNVSPARDHKEVRKSTGHTVVTDRYSNKQGTQSRQNPCQFQPAENIGTLSASRRRLWVRTTVSTVWSAAIFSEPELNIEQKMDVQYSVI